MDLYIVTACVQCNECSIVSRAKSGQCFKCGLINMLIYSNALLPYFKCLNGHIDLPMQPVGLCSNTVDDFSLRPGETEGSLTALHIQPIRHSSLEQWIEMFSSLGDPHARERIQLFLLNLFHPLFVILLVLLW